MTLLEFLLVILVIAVIAFMIYYFLKGSKAPLDIRRPVESRVDEYLDRRFEDLINEWSLVTSPRLKSFRDRADKQLDTEEERIAALKVFGNKMTTDLDALEARINALEKESTNPAASRKR